MSNLQLLLVEDNPLDAEPTHVWPETANPRADITPIGSEIGLIVQLSAWTLSATLAGCMLSQFMRAEVLDIARRTAPQTPLIFVSGALGEEHTADMLKHDTADYVIGQRLQRLPVALLQALIKTAERRQYIAAGAALYRVKAHFRLPINALKGHAAFSPDLQSIVCTWGMAPHNIPGYVCEDIFGKSAEILHP